jgi:hypothetical protein
MGGRRIAEEGRKQKAEGRNGGGALLTHRLHHRLTRSAEHFRLLPSAFCFPNEKFALPNAAKVIRSLQHTSLAIASVYAITP